MLPPYDGYSSVRLFHDKEYKFHLKIRNVILPCAFYDVALFRLFWSLESMTFPRPFLHITLQYLKSKLATPFCIQCKIQVRLKNEKNDWKEKTFTQIYIVACLIICSRFAEQCISNTLKSTLSSIHVQTSTKYDITKEN